MPVFLEHLNAGYRVAADEHLLVESDCEVVTTDCGAVVGHHLGEAAHFAECSLAAAVALLSEVVLSDRQLSSGHYLSGFYEVGSAALHECHI